MITRAGRSSVVRDFVTGVRLFVQGLLVLLRRPRLLLLGALPALLTTLLLVGAMVVLAYWVDDLATLLTPFAEGWAAGWQAAVRIGVGIAIVGAALVIGLISFSALTLAIGAPLYELIAEKVEDELGDAAGAVDLPWSRLLWFGIRDGIVLVARSLLFTIPLLLAGFVPLVGQTVVPVLLALVTAWFLALELVGVSFYRRGMDLEQRRAVLAGRRGLAVGLGLPATLLCAIPFAALVVMPVAFTGGVLVAHEALRDTAPARQR
jgi:CysZ protein